MGPGEKAKTKAGCPPSPEESLILNRCSSCREMWPLPEPRCSKNKGSGVNEYQGLSLLHTLTPAGVSLGQLPPEAQGQGGLRGIVHGDKLLKVSETDRKGQEMDPRSRVEANGNC